MWVRARGPAHPFEVFWANSQNPKGHACGGLFRPMNPFFFKFFPSTPKHRLTFEGACSPGPVLGPPRPSGSAQRPKEKKNIKALRYSQPPPPTRRGTVRAPDERALTLLGKQPAKKVGVNFGSSISSPGQARCSVHQERKGERILAPK